MSEELVENECHAIVPYYIRMADRAVMHAAIDALLDDGAEFTVTTSGDTASITVYDSRSLRILRRFPEEPTQ